MRTTYNVNFYCRSSKTNKNGQAPIELSITLNGTRKFINLPFKCSPKDFNAKKQPEYIRQYVDTMRVRTATILTDMATQGIPVTVDRIREYIQTGGVKSYTIQNLFDDFTEILRGRIGKDLTEASYRKYIIVQNLFFEHIDPSKECTDITPAVIRSFQTKINATRELSSTAGMLTKLKAVIRYGMDNYKIKVNPFQGIKIPKGTKPIEYLTIEEVEILTKAKLENQSLQKVLDCAIFQIGSGLSYVDMLHITSNDIQEDNGVYFINKNRIKTNTEYVAVLLPCAVDVCKKYNGHLPVISCQKYNTYLKVIGDILGLSRISLHSHLFRHTYCTLLLNRGVNLKTVSKAAGHANSKVTETFYAHLETKTILNEISKVI